MTAPSEKPYTDESELLCWHWDYCVGRSVKGVNFLTCLYRTQEVALPVAFQLIQKSEWTTDKKTGKRKRVCPKTKNDYFREMVAQCQKNQVPFRFVLADIWFGSAENMIFLKSDLTLDFIFPLKENRKVALSSEDKLAGRYQSVSSVVLEANATQEIWLEGVVFPLLLCKQVFTNKDGSQGTLSLVMSDTALSGSKIQTISQKRGEVEECHKSVKSNASFAKSPTKTTRTQSNHIFACLWAYVKLESLKTSCTINPFPHRQNTPKLRLYNDRRGVSKNLFQKCCQHQLCFSTEGLFASAGRIVACPPPAEEFIPPFQVSFEIDS